MDSSRVRLVCLILAFAWPMLARASATPLFELRVRVDQSEYVVGEPVRLVGTLRNASSETLFFDDLPVYLSLTPPRGKAEFCSIDERVAGTELTPGDSISFFLYPSLTKTRVSHEGARLGTDHNFETFTRAGRYRLRIFCRPQSPRGSCFSLWRADRTESNEISLHMRSPKRNETPVVNALRRAGTLTNDYYRGVYRVRDGSFHMEDVFLEELRAVTARRPNSPLIAYAKYAIARMLLDDAIDYPNEHQLEMGQAIEALEALRFDHPEFRRDEVTYHFASALTCSDVYGLAYGDRARADKLMTELLDRRPDLNSNPDYALLAQTASQTDHDIEIRLQLDQGEYVIDEPMLFRVTLLNRSDRTVRVPSHSLWTPGVTENFAGRIEIEEPDGKRMLRMSGFPTHGGPGSGYRGMPLAPGDSIVCVWDRTVLARTVEALGYLSWSKGQRVLGAPGVYQIRIGVSPPAAWWHVWGAGGMVLSKPLRVVMRAPVDAEKQAIEAVKKGRVDNIMGIGRDGTEIRALALETPPDENFSYHLRRGLAWAYARPGPNNDGDRSLTLLKLLEQTTEGLRREWVLMQELDVLGMLAVGNRSGAVHKMEARRVIAELERVNPTIWADSRFYIDVFHALYGREGARYSGCWSSSIHRSGFRMQLPVDLE